jgi:hypothetical protein
MRIVATVLMLVGVGCARHPEAQSSKKSSVGGDCFSGADCASNQYCKFDPTAACGGVGTCTDKEFACPHICTAVCGCDGTSYDNYCFAHRAGTDVAFSGFCEQSPKVGCWGISQGRHCDWATAQGDCNPNGKGAGYQEVSVGDSNMYCTTAATCGTIPDGCDQFGGPVIGLDNASYDSECDAYWNGRVPPACHWNSGPVCGTDGNTYASECDAFLQHQAYIIGSSGC